MDICQYSPSPSFNAVKNLLTFSSCVRQKSRDAQGTIPVRFSAKDEDQRLHPLTLQI